MKKLFSVLLVLALASLCALAGAEDIPAVEMEATYEGEYVLVSGTNLVFLLPSDLTAVEAPEGVNGDVYMGMDGQLFLTVQVSEGVLEDAIPNFREQLESGALSQYFQIFINDVNWHLVCSADNTQNIAMTQINDSEILSFAFVVADGSLEYEHMEEMLSTLAMAVEE